ncbi:MAG: transposase [Tepidisphaerales bacterium]
MLQNSHDPPSPAGFDWKKAQLVHRDKLPHVRQDNVIYFVTFRLADSLPVKRTRELREQRDRWLAANPRPHPTEQAKVFRTIWTTRIENLMDAGHGECPLANRDCREIVEGVLRHDDGSLYLLGAFVIMPNHVHALVQILPVGDLSMVVKAWKSLSARHINQLLQLSGSLWQEEYFDHVVRDTASLGRFITYIRQNPSCLPAGDYTLGSGSLRVEE